MVWAIPDISMFKSFVTLIKNSLPIIFIIIVFPFFFWGGPTAFSTKLFGALWNCGHVAFFAVLIIALSERFDVRNWRIALAMGLAVFVGGGLIEIIQTYVGRDGNWADILLDVSGAWLALFWMLPSSKWIWLGRVTSIALLTPNLFLVINEARYQYNAIGKFPLIAGFESSIELLGYKNRFELSDQFHTQGSMSVKIKLTTDRYSGITFNRLFNDWSSYKLLKYDIYNPEAESFELHIRVNDVQHDINGWQTNDRFNQSFIINPGWNQLVFSVSDIQQSPVNRQMNLAKISQIVIFSRQLPQGRTIYLDNLRLE